MISSLVDDALRRLRSNPGAMWALAIALGIVALTLVGPWYNPNGAEAENFDLGGELYLSKHWGITAYGNRDLQQHGWVIRDVGAVYRDECTRVDVVYRKEDVILGRLHGSESVTVRLTLATLGGPIYGH